MQTAKQAALIQSLLSQISDDDRKIYEPMIQCLLELGYTPSRHQKSTFALAFTKNGRTIAKLEVGGEPKKAALSLRFSACSQYSKVFEDAVARRPQAWVQRNQEYVSFDPKDCCGNCKGNPRFYRFTNSRGQQIIRCGGYTLPIPGITAEDVPELLRLLKEQDAYFVNILRV